MTAGVVPLSRSTTNPVSPITARTTSTLANLFGLSTDYEVFLVSRMHEEWTLTGDNKRAVIPGQTETGRVITAASLIMILVFAAFIFGGQEDIKQIGLGFAAAIFVDVYLIRTVLVPTVMHLLGRANWWAPGWLDRLLPRLHVEPSELPVAGPLPRPAGAGPRPLLSGSHPRHEGRGDGTIVPPGAGR